MPILGGARVKTQEERLEKLLSSAAYGGQHVPVPRGIKAVQFGRARIRTLADITSKLKNETASSKAKKK